MRSEGSSTHFSSQRSRTVASKYSSFGSSCLVGRKVRSFLSCGCFVCQVPDPRTEDPKVYADTCTPSGSTIYGVGATVDARSGKVTDRGAVKDSVVVELSGWNTHTITSLVFAILATEAVRT